MGAMCSEKVTLSGSSGEAGFGSPARAAVVVPRAHSSAARAGKENCFIVGFLEKRLIRFVVGCLSLRGERPASLPSKALSTSTAHAPRALYRPPPSWPAAVFGKAAVPTAM